MITLNLGSEPGLHLLEPHVWALIWHAMSEQLARHVGDLEHRNIRSATPDEIATALQLLVLNERVSISYKVDENLDKAGKEFGQAPVDLRGLANTGLVRVIEFPDHFRDDFPERFELNTLRERWKRIRPYLERYEPFILAQFKSRRFTPLSHWALYRYILAVRTGNSLMASLVKPSILPEDYGYAQVVVPDRLPDADVFSGLDLKFFNAARRVHHAFSLALRGDVRVSGASPSFDVPGAAGKAEASSKVWKIIVSTLIEEEIQFPVPTSFTDVIRLRSIPEVRAFREFVGPFIDKLVVGDETAFKALRKEIKAAVRALKLLPGAKRLLDFTTYAGVAISVIEAMTGAIGPSIVTGAAAVGLTRLATEWQRQTRWLYLSSDFQNQTRS